MPTIINGSSPSITFSDSTTQASAGLTSSSALNATNITTGTLPAARLPTGSVLQVVQTVKTDTFSVSSTTLTQVTGLTVSITPSSASNKILVMFSGMASTNNGENVSLQLQRNSTPIFIGDASGSRLQCFFGANSYSGSGALPMSATFLDSPSTTSATTYSVYMRGSSTVYLNRTVTDENEANRGRTASSIIVMEIAG